MKHFVLLLSLCAALVLTACDDPPRPTHKGVLPVGAQSGSVIEVWYQGRHSKESLLRVSDDRTQFQLGGSDWWELTDRDGWALASAFDRIDLVAR